MNRSLVILTMGIVGVISGAAGLFHYIRSNPPATEIILSSDSEMRSFLSECGHPPKNEPPLQQEITLPASSDSSVFGTYCALQSEQNLPLSQHFGENAIVWTYAVDGLPTARAELICTKDGLLVGAMYYDRLNFHRMYPVIT